ncbi:PEP-CTERM sorting domain-containing protein, partial [Lutibacter sp.]|uniref:PEP-CTERM sorting domain-containing protein n=1 Tax=Lutibacter sp. TaxID=1925666 RepID=UPI0027369878
ALSADGILYSSNYSSSYQNLMSYDTKTGAVSSLGSPFGSGVTSIAVSVPAVPEPETYGMMLMGLGLMGFVARLRKQA